MAKIKFEFVNGKIGEVEIDVVKSTTDFIDEYFTKDGWFVVKNENGKGCLINLDNITNIQID